jgi:ribosomal protein S13
MNNQEIAKNLAEIAALLDIKGEKPFRIRAYRKAAEILNSFEQNLDEFYRKEKKLPKIKGIGESLGAKIEELLKTKKITYLKELQEETAIRQIITYFFETKGVNLQQLKQSARKRDIVYSRYTKPAKQLIELAGSPQLAKVAIKKVADWANSRKLDYAIETVFKKWLELDRLKPKEIVKKPFYLGDPMVWSENRKKWFVIMADGEWLEYADKEEKIEWRIID